MRRAVIAVLAVVLTAARAQEAFGECSISTLEINGAITLCADGGDEWQWNGPSGFVSGAMCIEPVADGTYTLRVYDGLTGTWSEPCSHLIGTPVVAPTCEIAGPDSVCADATVEWCGPAGEMTYLWSGPVGFIASTACFTPPGPGTYALSVSDRVSGATGEPCSKTLFAKDCSTPEPPQPPPPPPGPQQTMCPAPPRWWSISCDARSALVNPTTFAQIAQRVDEHSAVWAFAGQPAGLCALLAPQRHGRPFQSARRQFAAVHANLAAAELGATEISGRPIGLSSGMTLEGIRGIPAGTTLGAWVAATEASLLAMGDGSSRDRRAREEWRRIRRQAREINVGARRDGCGRALASMLDDDEDDDDGLLSGGASTLVSGGGPSPFSGGNRMRWTLERAGDVQLDIVDLSGRRVRHLANGQFAVGTHEFTWDGRDDSGRSLQPGAYFVSGRVADARVAQRLILLR